MSTMSDYVIVSDSTADITGKMAKELDVVIIPFQFHLEGKTYNDLPDGKEMDFHTFYEKLRSGIMSTTSQVNSQEFIHIFEPILKEGKDVLYIGFSSGLSGTYYNSCMAREELKEKYPERQIKVFDTRCASMGQGLFLYKAAMLKKQGKDMDFVYDWMEKNVLHLCHWFTVDDLHHLKRGGRVSTATAVVGTMLGIKPVLHVDNDGHLIPVDKVRGRRQSLDALVKKMEKTVTNPEEQTVFISHGDCKADAEYVADQIREKMKVKDIHINFIGPVIGAHSGPGTVALFFMGTER